MAAFSVALMDHFESPRNAGKIESPTHLGRASCKGRAPYIDLFLVLEDGRIVDAKFLAFGCGVTIACCSALTEAIIGKTDVASLGLTADDLIGALGGLPPNKRFCARQTISALHDALSHEVPRQHE
ncbi:MAG: iron-sulfur cluster assembly scaffold protein [Planctomycetota bacterium]|nr:MAG: iron-sulfur cluster assembly scaffold protein [Planctomycetota bacterium]REK25816.1 MAG: iron-sulfur cluster assembly scaffold protein [Planctomycetota bacterium]REK49487.1 MAG: iron-sulfur cluster assembly scaffold protein [Planctomycetota bacterium]